MTDDKIEEHLVSLIEVTTKLSEQVIRLETSITDIEAALRNVPINLEDRLTKVESRVTVLEQAKVKKAQEIWTVVRNYILVAISAALVSTVPLLIKELLK